MAQTRRTRILIVDDSAVMRSLLRAVVAADPALEVAGTAADGESALAAVSTLRPDLVLLDVEMPVLDGLVTLGLLRTRGYKMPVIMCSALTQRGAHVTIEALAVGASDYVAKPSDQASRKAAIEALGQDLLPRIRALTRGVCERLESPERQAFISPPCRQTKLLPFAPTVVVIGVSTGGPAALDVLLPALPENFPLPVLIVQHMPELFTGHLAERLDHRCRLRVREACDGDAVRPGTMYLARGNWHMEVLALPHNGVAAKLRVDQRPLENHCRPAVDVLFRSAAAVYASGVLAVVLTGMGSDGLSGCRSIRKHDGFVIAQDQASSAVWGMPGVIANAGLADRVLPLSAIAPEILRLTACNQKEASGLRESVG